MLLDAEVTRVIGGPEVVRDLWHAAPGNARILERQAHSGELLVVQVQTELTGGHGDEPVRRGGVKQGPAKVKEDELDRGVARHQEIASIRRRRSPLGVDTLAISPSFFPITAWATGEAEDIRPSAGLASLGETILKVCFFSVARSVV